MFNIDYALKQVGKQYNMKPLRDYSLPINTARWQFNTLTYAPNKPDPIPINSSLTPLQKLQRDGDGEISADLGAEAAKDKILPTGQPEVDITGAPGEHNEKTMIAADKQAIKDINAGNLDNSQVKIQL